MRRIVLAAPLLATAAALTACGSSPSQPSVDAWADKMCKVLAGPQYPQWVAAVSSLSTPQGNLSPAEARANISNALAVAASYDNAVADALKTSGTPNLANAADLVNQAAQNLRDAANALLAEKAKVDVLPTTNQAQFAQSLQDVAGDIGAVGTQNTAAFDSIATGTLGQALNKSEQCQQMAALPSASVAPASASPLFPVTTPPASTPPATGPAPTGTATPSASPSATS